MALGALLKTALKLTSTKIKNVAQSAKNAIVETVRDIVKPFAKKNNVSRETLESVQTPTIAEEPVNYTKIINDIEPTPPGNDTELFKFLLRNAGDPMLSSYDPADVQAFFIGTKYIWNKPGIPLDKRLDAIADYFNMSLEDIFESFIKSGQYLEYLEDLFEGGSPDFKFEVYEYNGYQVGGSIA